MLDDNGDTAGEGGVGTPGTSRSTGQPLGCTLTAYARVKDMPVDYLRSLGITEIIYLSSPAVRIPYLDHSNNETAVRFRIGLNKGGHGEIDNRFRWRKGSKLSLYGLWRLDPQAKEIVPLEGGSG